MIAFDVIVFVPFYCGLIVNVYSAIPITTAPADATGVSPRSGSVQRLAHPTAQSAAALWAVGCSHMLESH